MIGARPTLKLALSLAGFVDPRAPGADAPRTIREAIDRAARAGYRGIALDGTMHSVRARDLDRSARRDLAAAYRRAGLASAGVDLWIPPEHLDDPRHTDRAIGAVAGALELAGDLASLTDGQRVLSIALPRSDATPAPWRRTLEEEAERLGVRIANCAWPPPTGAHGPIGIGIDPALALAAGEAPGRAAARAGASLAMVRVTDWNGISRVPVGRGRLDAVSFAVSVATTGYAGFGVVDVRGTPDPGAAATIAVERVGVPPDAR